MLTSLALLALSQTTPVTAQELFGNYFAGPFDKQVANSLEKLTWNEKYRSVAWTSFSKAPQHNVLGEEFKSQLIKTDDRSAPFKFRIVGSAETGKPLPIVIAMHGGGSGPKEMNDQQWDGMFTRYYRDSPPHAPYIYCALRAPNDEWNGFYDDSIAQVLERLILAFTLFANGDPNHVVITGASHGGYGAFVIAPKIPHRFAAANASASAPTDGETEGINLRNLYFTWVNGETDTAFGRAERVLAFDKKWQEWKAEHGGFTGGMTFLANTGHFVPDREKPAELLQQKRNPAPDKLIWVQTDERVKTHYYLVDPKPISGRKITLEIQGKTITIVNNDAKELTLYLPQNLVQKEMVVVWGKSSSTHNPIASSLNFAESLSLYGDPSFASPYKISLTNNE